MQLENLFSYVLFWILIFQMYGFEGEVRAKYEAQMSDLFTETFCQLPLCHLINKKIFVRFLLSQNTIFYWFLYKKKDIRWFVG